METTRSDQVQTTCLTLQAPISVSKPERDLSKILGVTVALMLLPGQSLGAPERVHKFGCTKPAVL